MSVRASAINDFKQKFLRSATAQLKYNGMQQFLGSVKGTNNLQSKFALEKVQMCCFQVKQVVFRRIGEDVIHR